jgi:lysozyme
MILQEDITDALKDCYKFDWFARLNDARQLVICNIVFNMGLTRFSGFKKTIGYIEIEQYEDAAKEMLDSKWAKQVGDRATRLSKIFAKGEF